MCTNTQPHPPHTIPIYRWFTKVLVPLPRPLGDEQT